MKLPKFISEGFEFVRDRAPPLSHALATVAALSMLVFVIHSMQDLDDDPLRYPGRDFHDEARVAKRKAAEDGNTGYYFNYEGHTYYQPPGGGQAYYVGPAKETGTPSQ